MENHQLPGLVGERKILGPHGLGVGRKKTWEAHCPLIGIAEEFLRHAIHLPSGKPS